MIKKKLIPKNSQRIITSNNSVCIVSIKHHKILSKYKWYINIDGYVIACIDGKKWRIHRYIFIILLKKNIDHHIKIDNINNNKLDNREENLRIVTNSENARNKLKKSNSSSKYYGVCVNTYSSNPKHKFRVKLIINSNLKLNAYYNIELHAAYQYNLWIEKYKITHCKFNNIKNPKKFIEYIKPKKSGDLLPKGIYLNKNGKYHVQMYINDNTPSHRGFFENLKDAITQLNITLKEKATFKLDQILSKPINRNENNQAIIIIKNKKKEVISETIIDEKIYYKLMKYPWRLCKNGYIVGKIENNKDVYLSRYVTDYSGKDIVDHINNNKLDNRKENLRIVTIQENSFNKLSQKNSTSKYIGVSWNKGMKKWCSAIFYKEKITLGYFDNEEEAAKVRDQATLKYFKEHGNLNFKN